MNLSLHTIATSSQDDLILRYKLSRAEIKAATQIDQPAPMALADMTPKALSTGIKGLDALLGGGVFTRRITEISGACATGKTLLCLSLALGAQLSDTRKVCYVASEPGIIFRRLKQLDIKQDDASSRIVAAPRPVTTAEALLSLLDSSELVAQFASISALIIDTLHWLETPDLVRCLARLRKAALKYNFAVILTNGVVSTPPFEIDEFSSTVPQGAAREIPYVMGTSAHSWGDHPRMGWGLARNVDTRIMLSRPSRNVRRLRVLYSSDCEPKSCFYAITQKGIEITRAPIQSPAATSTQRAPS